MGVKHDIGQVKIGYAGQLHGWTAHAFQSQFPSLSRGYFSLGQDTSYYSRLHALPSKLRKEFLEALCDVVHDHENLKIAKAERVFKDSLLRGVNYSTIQDQFKRVLDGGAILTNFHFGYRTEATDLRAGFNLTFNVTRDLKPSTNIHVFIGRNGIGKTTLLNGMIASLVGEHPMCEEAGKFINLEFGNSIPITHNYFSGVVSVSFSAFDPFTPPLDRDGDATALRYSYIGLKKIYFENETLHSKHKDLPALSEDFASKRVDRNVLT